MGFETRGSRIVGADETTELWWPPKLYNMLVLEQILFKTKFEQNTLVNQRVSKCIIVCLLRGNLPDLAAAQKCQFN